MNRYPAFPELRKFTSTPPPVLNMPKSSLKFINPRLIAVMMPVRLGPKLQQQATSTPISKVRPIEAASDTDNMNRIGIEASRYLQDAYEKGNLETRNALFRSEVQKDSSVHIAEMALDKYMHYVLEKILDLGPLGHKQWIFEAVLLHKDQLWGAKYAQKIFAKCIEISKSQSRDHYLLFVDFVRRASKQLRYDPQGNQIIQKCLELFEEEHLTVLLSDLNQNIVDDEWQQGYDLCTHQFGCLVVNKIIEISQTVTGRPRLIINRIIDRIIARSVELAMTRYSNYVIQQILLRGSKDQYGGLVGQLAPNFTHLARNKYGSNVAEKIVETSTELERLFGEQIYRDLETLVNDSYANYVMQKLFKCSANVKNVRASFVQALIDLDQAKRLSQNGQIVLRFVMQSMQSYNPYVQYR